MKTKSNTLLFLFTMLLLNYVNGSTYYVSVQGENTNAGTKSQPFRTIQRAADVAIPGDTIYVREGVYRERVVPPRGGEEGKEIVYMGEPNKKVFIKGSDIWTPKWLNESDNIFYAIPEDSLFNDDVYVDNKNPFKVPVSSTPYGLDGAPEVARGYGGDPNLVLSIGQVFVDGKLYTQKGYLNQTISSANSWYYNPKTGAINIRFPDNTPQNHIVEISTRRRIFAPHKRQLGYIVVEGFIMEHCGNQYPTNFWQSKNPECQQAGALGTRSGHHWTIKNNTIRFANGIGIDCGNEGNRYVDLETGNNGEAYNAGHHIIDSNYITDNGGGGTAAYYPDYITFTNNIVERNNNLYFDGAKRWESAGVKMHAPNHSIISNNLIRNNYAGWGLWLDQGSGDSTRVHGNLIIGHEKGFDLEIGGSYADKLIFDNNILIDNEIGICSRESGGITTLNNLILGSSKYGLENKINKKRNGDWGSSAHHHFNNIFIDNANHVAVETPEHSKTKDRQFDYNIYTISGDEDKWGIHNGKSDLNFDEWKAAWKIYNTGILFDGNAKIANNTTYFFNKKTLQLIIKIDSSITKANIYMHQSLDLDYNGKPILKDGTAIPGPFQNLAQGENSFDLSKTLGIKNMQLNH